MVNDEVFRDSDTYILDECITFMLAATMTTTLLITNSIYYLAKYPDVAKKLRTEIARVAQQSDFSKLTSEQWSRLLLYDDQDPESDLLSRCEYLGHCVNETLRIDPSARLSTPHEISDNITLGGVHI